MIENMQRDMFGYFPVKRITFSFKSIVYRIFDEAQAAESTARAEPTRTLAS